jgi:hypothetical protein
MRDSLFPDEMQLAAKILKAGAEWPAVRSMFTDVDPEAMDKNFKEHLLDLAGLSVPTPKPPAVKPAAKKPSDPLE